MYMYVILALSFRGKCTNQTHQMRYSTFPTPPLMHSGSTNPSHKSGTADGNGTEHFLADFHEMYSRCTKRSAHKYLVFG